MMKVILKYLEECLYCEGVGKVYNLEVIDHPEEWIKCEECTDGKVGAEMEFEWVSNLDNYCSNETDSSRELMLEFNADGEVGIYNFTEENITDSLNPQYIELIEEEECPECEKMNHISEYSSLPILPIIYCLI